ncbi:MAG: hypothetical protein V4669_16490 [Pseudomonadota bacterium]
MEDHDRTASLMTPAKLAQVKPKAAASPAAWLNQMAADAAHQHVKRIAELRNDLKEQGKDRDYSAMTTELARVAKSLPKLDFGLLQNHGLWARVTGKAKSATEEFASRFSRLQEASVPLADEIQKAQKQQQDKAPASDLALLELEVEYKAIEKVQDQGTRWLQDMRNQLKAREAEAADDEARKLIRDDEVRCEILVARLKALREVSAAAQQVHQHGQAAAARRAALAQSLQQGVSARLRNWSASLQEVVSAAQESQPFTLDAAMESHRELQLAMKDAAADCAQLHSQEKTLAESLSALRRQLQAAQVNTA